MIVFAIIILIIILTIAFRRPARKYLSLFCLLLTHTLSKKRLTFGKNFLPRARITYHFITSTRAHRHSGLKEETKLQKEWEEAARNLPPPYPTAFVIYPSTRARGGATGIPSPLTTTIGVRTIRRPRRVWRATR
jgi:hypothetical protein